MFFHIIRNNENKSIVCSPVIPEDFLSVFRTFSGLVLVSTGALKLVKLSACNALNGKPKYKR